MPETSLSDAARQLGFELDAVALERFDTYRSLIIDSAARFNLTAVREPGAIEERLFLDALALGRVLAKRSLLPEAARVLDLGSGAGLPGLPLKIARPDLDLTLLEAHGKRCEFLRSVVAALKLEHVRVVQGRAEELGHDTDLRESFDLVVARAVAPLPVLIEYALPFLRPGGHLAATKGAAAEREVEQATRALAELGGSLVDLAAYETPSGVASTVVVIAKTGPTPGRYPRRTGIPAKRPLN